MGNGDGYRAFQHDEELCTLLVCAGLCIHPRRVRGRQCVHMGARAHDANSGERRSRTHRMRATHTARAVSRHWHCDAVDASRLASARRWERQLGAWPGRRIACTDTDASPATCISGVLSQASVGPGSVRARAWTRGKQRGGSAAYGIGGAEGDGDGVSRAR